MQAREINSLEAICKKMAPVLIFIPGFWESLEHYQKLLTSLSTTYETSFCALPSTGTTSPGNPSMHDDTAAVRESVISLVAEEKSVVMIMHSAGGLIGSNAIRGLSAKERAEQGLKGGIIGLVFIPGAIFPLGHAHEDLPAGKISVRALPESWNVLTLCQGGSLLCINPATTLFNDLSPELADEWSRKLKSRPTVGWNGTVTYCGWAAGPPSVYLVCETDRAIPPPIQYQLAQMAGSKIETCSAGHLPHVSMPERVVEVIKNAIASF